MNCSKCGQELTKLGNRKFLARISENNWPPKYQCAPACNGFYITQDLALQKAISHFYQYENHFHGGKNG